MSPTSKKAATRATIEWAAGRDSTYLSQRSIAQLIEAVTPATPATIVETPATIVETPATIVETPSADEVTFNSVSLFFLCWFNPFDTNNFCDLFQLIKS